MRASIPVQGDSLGLVIPHPQNEGEHLSSSLALELLRPTGALYKEYLNVSMLHRMYQSPGSSVLTAFLATLDEPLSVWTPDDIGVDEHGIYELVIESDLYQHAESLPSLRDS